MIHQSPSVRATLGSLWSLVTPDHFPTRPAAECGVAYTTAPRNGVPPLADVYLPDPLARSGASVVLVHGGGFVIGSRQMKPMRLLAGALTEAGHAVCSLDYRLIFRGGRLAEASADVLEGLRWWSRRVPTLGLDPERIGILGLSAGGALTVLAAGHADAPPLWRVVSVFGLYDFRSLGGPLASRLPRLLTRTSDRDAWRRASPAFAPQPRAPMLMLHGTADGLVPHTQAHALAERRAGEGLVTDLRLYHGAPHAFLNTPGAIADQATADILGFLAAQPVEAVA